MFTFLTNCIRCTPPDTNSYLILFHTSVISGLACWGALCRLSLHFYNCFLHHKCPKLWNRVCMEHVSLMINRTPNQQCLSYRSLHFLFLMIEEHTDACRRFQWLLMTITSSHDGRYCPASLWYYHARAESTCFQTLIGRLAPKDLHRDTLYSISLSGCKFDYAHRRHDLIENICQANSNIVSLQLGVLVNVSQCSCEWLIGKNMQDEFVSPCWMFFFFNPWPSDLFYPLLYRLCLGVMRSNCLVCFNPSIEVRYRSVGPPPLSEIRHLREWSVFAGKSMNDW